MPAYITCWILSSTVVLIIPQIPDRAAASPGDRVNSGSMRRTFFTAASRRIQVLLYKQRVRYSPIKARILC